MLKNAKIYKISSPQIDKFYIGSTRNDRLEYRFYQHRLACWTYEDGGKQRYCSSFEVMKYNDAQIVLLEAFEAVSSNMVLSREQYWIDKYAGQTVNRGTAFKHGSFHDEEPEICENALSGPPSPSPIADSPIDKEYPRGRERTKKKEARLAAKPDPRARAVSRTPVPNRETETLPSMLTKSSPKSVATNPKKSTPKTIRGKAVAATAATPMTQTQAKAMTKVVCCCGSSLLASSLLAHYKTAKHTRGLAAMAKV